MVEVDPVAAVVVGGAAEVSGGCLTGVALQLDCCMASSYDGGAESSLLATRRVVEVFLRLRPPFLSSLRPVMLAGVRTRGVLGPGVDTPEES